jgi:lysophospholipase L1-like esterase
MVFAENWEDDYRRLLRTLDPDAHRRAAMVILTNRVIPVLVALAAGLPSASNSCLGAVDFALRDGDTVVFLGDSITAARTYGKIVENYTLLRYPDRRVHFHNAGWGGDTAAGGLGRLDRDVFANGATVLIVAYGVNDIGWGTKADAEHKEVYLESIRGLVKACKQRGVRAFICSAAITAEDPDRAEHGFLQAMCDEGMALSRSLGEHAIDVQRAMRRIQRTVTKANATAKPQDRLSLHVSDGVHLSDLGQLAMAFAILKGLDAPADVSAVAIDARGPRIVAASGCRISGLSGDGSRIEFDRLDDGLPINFGLFGALPFRLIPIPDELNRYMLIVKNLPAGRYEVKADDRSLGRFSEEQLADGLNIASATADGWEPGGPWDAQAWIVREVTEARSQLAASRRLLDHYLPAHPARDAIHEQDAEIDAKMEDLQRMILKPRPFHFVIRSMPPT